MGHGSVERTVTRGALTDIFRIHSFKRIECFGPHPCHCPARGRQEENCRQPCSAPTRGSGEEHFRQGSSAICVRPSVSGRPNAMFIACTACPAAPLTRLSSTTSTIARFLDGRCTAIRATLEPRTERVSGQLPAGITSTNGSDRKSVV